MTATLRARPTAVLLWAAAAAIVLAIAGAAVTVTLEPDRLFLLAAVGVTVVAALALLPQVDPAVPLSAGLAASVFSGNWERLGLPIGLDRPLILYGVAGVLLSVLPDAPRRRRLRVTGIHLLLAFVALYVICSAVLSGTLLESQSVFSLLDKLSLTGFLLFLVAPVAFGTERARRILLITLVALGAYLSLTALFEALDLSSLILPRYISDPNVGIHVDRARGPFVEASANGLALFSCLVASVIGAVQWRDDARAVSIAVAVLCGLALILTLTRQIWLGASIAAVVTMVADYRLRRHLVAGIAAVAIGVTAALLIVPGLRQDIVSRAEQQGPILDRRNSNRAALAMVEARPLFGFGWNRFDAESTPYYAQADDYPLSRVAEVHNVFLGYAAELGLVGATAWLLALLLAIGVPLAGRAPPSLDLWRVGLLAIAVNWLVVANFTPLPYTFANLILWLWAGVVWARFSKPDRESAAG